MHRFSRDYLAYGVFFAMFAVIFGLTSSLHPSAGGTVCVGIIAAFAIPTLWFRSQTVFEDGARRVTHRSGFFPFQQTRQVHYDDIDKLVLSGRTASTTQGGRYPQYDLKLYVRGSSNPISLANYGEAGIRSEEPIIQAVCVSNHFALEDTSGYQSTRDRWEGTRTSGHAGSPYLMAGGFIGLVVAVYFYAAHAGIPVPFHESIEPLFHSSSRKTSTGESIEVVATMVAFVLGLIGLSNHNQKR